MAKNLSLKVENLKTLRTIDSKLLSYNVEMTEVTGGTFWKEYTKGQLEGTEGFPLVGITKKAEMVQVYPPIDLYNTRIRKLAKELGPGKTVVTVLPDTAERYFSTPLFDE